MSFTYKMFRNYLGLQDVKATFLIFKPDNSENPFCCSLKLLTLICTCIFRVSNFANKKIGTNGGATVSAKCETFISKSRKTITGFNCSIDK